MPDRDIFGLGDGDTNSSLTILLLAYAVLGLLVASTINATSHIGVFGVLGVTVAFTAACGLCTGLVMQARNKP